VNDNWEETLKNDLIDRARKNLREQGRMGGSAPTQLSNSFLRYSGDLEKIRDALEQPNNEYLVAEALKRVNELIEMAKQR
tara:strand:+ start:1948 stop:2187 length:240 start_codon:yes stop_codon:yes gene_type:complete